MNELLIQVTFYLNAFQMLEEVPNEWVVYDGLHDSNGIPTLLKCVDAKSSFQECNCSSGAREGKLKRRPLVVGIAVDNKIICSAPRSNKKSANFTQTKKSGFFCSDDLISSFLLFQFFDSLFISIAGGKSVLTALVSQLGSDGAQVLVESKVRSPRQTFSGSLPQSSSNIFSTTQLWLDSQQQQTSCQSFLSHGLAHGGKHRRCSGCLYIYPDQLPRSPGAWRRVDRRKKLQSGTLLVGKMTTREILLA